jgi:nitrate/nitrite transporter NarK
MLFVFQGVTAFLTTYFVVVKGLSEAVAGTLFGLLFLSAAVSQSVGGALADRYGHGRVLVIISLLGVVPLAALPYVERLPVLVAVVVFLGVRLAIGPISNAYIVSVLPSEIGGTAWGVLRTGFFIRFPGVAASVGESSGRYRRALSRCCRQYETYSHPRIRIILRSCGPRGIA